MAKFRIIFEGVLVVVFFAGLLASCESQTERVRDTADDSRPPVRFQGDRPAQMVAFVSDPAKVCRGYGLKDIPGTTVKACHVKGKDVSLIVARNPCKASGAYAGDLCHELGHANEWPGDHPK